MAYIQMSLFSNALKRAVPVNVILPIDQNMKPGVVAREEKPFKTMYLLHGVFGDCLDWMTYTRIRKYAEDHNLCVVLPSGDNMFYVDQKDAHNFYGEFVRKELVELTRKMFPLSRKREDTFIAGLSMGGYGALRNGLKYCDTFGYIVALSGALLIDEIPNREPNQEYFLGSREYAQASFGDLDKLLNSDMNPKWLLEHCTNMPQIYMACGNKDGLLKNNEDTVAFMKEKNIDVTFKIGEGGHEWFFWDTYIKDAIENFLPTEK